MKKINLFVTLLLLLTMLAGISGCDSKKIDMDDFKEIKAEKIVSEIKHMYHIPKNPEENSNGDILIQFGHLEERLNYTSFANQNDARACFEEQYSQYSSYSEQNPNEVIMEIGDDRGYIIFDLLGAEKITEASGIDANTLHTLCGYVTFTLIDDGEGGLISESAPLSEEEAALINDNIRYYGCIYYCGSVYIEATYTADREEYLDDFIDFLDELDLPHMQLAED